MVHMVVSRIEAGFATLVSEDHHFLELPLHMCPSDIEVGVVVNANIDANEEAEKEKLDMVLQLQQGLLNKYSAKREA